MNQNNKGTVGFNTQGQLVFSGWYIEGEATREFYKTAINMCAPNMFVRQTMLSML